MKQEKVYYSNDAVTITSSRVKIGDKSFVLRNISAVQVIVNKSEGGFLILFGIFFTVFFGMVGFYWSIIYDFDLFWKVATIFFIIAGVYIINLGANANKDTYSVEIHSGGTPTNILSGYKSREFPDKVVETINTAILEIDNAG